MMRRRRLTYWETIARIESHLKGRTPGSPQEAAGGLMTALDQLSKGGDTDESRAD